MNWIVGLLPIVFIIIIVVIFVTGKLKVNLTSSKRSIKLIIITYALVLCIAVVTYEFLPNENREFQTISDLEIEREMEESEIHFDQDSKYLQEHWSFSYEGNEINLKTANPDFFIVLIERKEQSDGTVDVFYFEKMIMDGYDLSGEMPIPNVEMNHDQLMFKYPEGTEVNIALFENDFTINQFKNEIDKDRGSWSYSENYIVLRVPKDLTIKHGDDLFIMTE